MYLHVSSLFFNDELFTIKKEICYTTIQKFRNITFIQSIRIDEGSDYSIVLKNVDDKLIVSQSRIVQLKEWFS